MTDKKSHILSRIKGLTYVLVGICFVATSSFVIDLTSYVDSNGNIQVSWLFSLINLWLAGLVLITAGVCKHDRDEFMGRFL